MMSASIHTKLNGMTAVTIVAIVASLTSFFPLREVSALRATQRDRAQLYAEMLATQLRSAVAFADRESDSLQLVREATSDLLAVIDGMEPRDAAAAEALDLPYLRTQVPEAFGRAIEGLGRVGVIVQSMRQVEVESELGRGTTFTIPIDGLPMVMARAA